MEFKVPTSYIHPSTLATMMTTSSVAEVYKNNNTDRQNKTLQMLVNSALQEYVLIGEMTQDLNITAIWGDLSAGGGKQKPIDCGRQQGDQLLTSEGVETHKIIVPFRLADPNKYKVEDIQNYVTEAVVHIIAEKRAGAITCSKGGSHNKLFEKWANKIRCLTQKEEKGRGYRIFQYNPAIWERSHRDYGVTANDIQIVAEDVEPEAKPSRPGGKRASWECACVRDDSRGISPIISCPDGSIKNITCGDCGQKFTKQS